MGHGRSTKVVGADLPMVSDDNREQRECRARITNVGATNRLTGILTTRFIASVGSETDSMRPRRSPGRGAARPRDAKRGSGCSEVTAGASEPYPKWMVDGADHAGDRVRQPLRVRLLAPVGSRAPWRVGCRGYTQFRILTSDYTLFRMLRPARLADRAIPPLSVGPQLAIFAIRDEADVAGRHRLPHQRFGHA
jgi:hypothetical protein